jgi:hypothetical protein
VNQGIPRSPSLLFVFPKESFRQGVYQVKPGNGVSSFLPFYSEGSSSVLLTAISFFQGVYCHLEEKTKGISGMDTYRQEERRKLAF